MTLVSRPRESPPVARTRAGLTATVLAASTFALLAACETTETTSSFSTIETLPEVALVAKLDILTNSDAEKARKKLEVRFRPRGLR